MVKTESSKRDLSTSDVNSLPFEAAMKELDAIVQKLETGAVSLEDSIIAYERGEQLKARCETLLTQAEARIEKIKLSPEGKPVGAAPLDME